MRSGLAIAAETSDLPRDPAIRIEEVNVDISGADDRHSCLRRLSRVGRHHGAIDSDQDALPKVGIRPRKDLLDEVRELAGGGAASELKRRQTGCRGLI